MEVQVNGPLPKRGESKPEYPEKTPDNQPENQYHRSEMKIHHPSRGSNPHPVTLVIARLVRTCWL